MSDLQKMEGLEAVVRKGQMIGRLLAEPVISEVFEETRNSLIDEWERATTTPAREAAHATLKGLTLFRHKLKAAVDAGEHAKSELTRPKRKLA